MEQVRHTATKEMLRELHITLNLASEGTTDHRLVDAMIYNMLKRNAILKQVKDENGRLIWVAESRDPPHHQWRCYEGYNYAPCYLEHPHTMLKLLDEVLPGMDVIMLLRHEHKYSHNMQQVSKAKLPVWDVRLRCNAFPLRDASLGIALGKSIVMALRDQILRNEKEEARNGQPG